MTGRRLGWLVLVAALMAGACGGDDGGGTIRLYTSVTQDTVDAVLAAFQVERPEVEVDVFRAPTGELTARIAAEQREGGLQADVLWLTDPLSIQQYDADGLLASWTPDGIDAIPEPLRTESFWGTRLLNLVIVHGSDVPRPPTGWSDLTEVAFADAIALPDPGFAGSAFGALAAFAQDEDFGFDYYRALAANGAIEVRSPGDVLTGVAEGRYAAGITLDKSARDAIAKGSPIELVWPRPGAVAIYSPIAVVASSDNAPAAESFTEFVLSPTGQQAIAETGWQPARTDVAWADGGPQLTVDWDAAFDRQEELLGEYRAIFGD